MSVDFLVQDNKLFYKRQYFKKMSYNYFFRS
jgi:hypothetical protein